MTEVIMLDGNFKTDFNSRDNRKGIIKLFRQKITIIGSGRTDKGVHAIEQCANFKINKRVEDKYKFLSSVNFFKNKFIAITDIVEKKLTFHSRFSAKKES